MKKLSLRILSFTMVLALCIGCSIPAFATAPKTAELPDLFTNVTNESDPISFEMPDLTGIDLNRTQLTKEKADARIAAIQADSASAALAAPAFVSTSDELVAAIADPDASIIFIMNDIEFDQTLRINRSINFVSMGGTVTLSLKYGVRSLAEVTGGNITLSFENVILEGNPFATGLGYTSESLTLRGAVIQNCYVGVHTTAAESGDLTVYDCVIKDNHAGDPGGAGIFLVGSDLIVYNSVIKNNTLTFEGGLTGGTGIYVMSGSAYIYQSEISENIAADTDKNYYNYAGILIVFGDLQLINSEVTANEATYGGGVAVVQPYYGEDPELSAEYPAYGQSSEVVIRNSKLNDNKGGGLLLVNCDALIENSEINRNTSTEGAGIRVFGSDITLRNTNIEENTAENNGGGISVSDSSFDGLDPINTSSVTFESGSISGNSGIFGGGVFLVTEEGSSEQTAFIMESGKLEQNIAQYGGGGIFGLNNPKILIYDGSISYNKIEYDIESGDTAIGGGIGFNGIYHPGLNGTLIVTGGEFIGNSAPVASAIGAATADISNAVFKENTASLGATVYGLTLTLTDCEISNNQNGLIGAVFVGGDKDNLSPSTITGSLIHHNESEAYGGAVYAVNCSLTIEDTAIYENRSEYGAAISLLERAELILNSGTIQNNYASNRGGAVYAEDSTFTLAGGSILSNEAGTAGGGIYSNATVNIRGGLIDDNYSVNGGGIYTEATGTLNLLGGELTYNTALNGGGIYSLGRLTISGGTISDNIASTSGGGVYSAGQAAMTAGEISYNTARNGGGIYTTSSFSFVGTGSIIYNSATAYGGGIYGSSTSIVLLYLVTLENNTARTDGNDIYSLGVIG